MSQDFFFKYILIGNSTVGKTTLLNRYLYNQFKDHDITVGVDVASFQQEKNGKKIKVQIWDTVGCYQIDPRHNSAYRRPTGAFLVYDVTRQSFDDAKGWLQEATQIASNLMTIILVGNKQDMEQQRQISEDEGLAFAQSHNIYYMETSAKTGYQVSLLFNLMTVIILDKMNKGIIDINDTEMLNSCGIQVMEKQPQIQQQKQWKANKCF